MNVSAPDVAANCLWDPTPEKKMKFSGNFDHLSLLTDDLPDIQFNHHYRYINNLLMVHPVYPQERI